VNEQADLYGIVSGRSLRARTRARFFEPIDIPEAEIMMRRKPLAGKRFSRLGKTQKGW
jgi:hypothetical protein